MRETFGSLLFYSCLSYQFNSTLVDALANMKLQLLALITIVVTATALPALETA